MSVMMNPIGYYFGASKVKQELPRQASLNLSANSHLGEVRLEKHLNYEQALEGLDGFRRIWLIFGFHQNQTWRPKVLPKNFDQKVGIFATRSPYRPNNIGMSCVELESVKGLCLKIRGADLLDGSPVFDIKPYIQYADSFSGEQALAPGCWWRPSKVFTLEWSEQASEKSSWLRDRIGPSLDFNLLQLVQTQLETEPFDVKRKRIRQLGPESWELAFRTWRIHYSVDETQRHVSILDICSGLLCEGRTDESVPGPVNSLQLHRHFVADFTNQV